MIAEDRLQSVPVRATEVAVDASLGSYQGERQTTSPATFRSPEAHRDDVRARDSERTGFQAGDYDVMLSGLGSNNRDWNQANAGVSASLGYLLSDITEISVRQGVFMGTDSVNGTRWSGYTKVAFDVFLAPAPVMPFVGVNLGRNYGDGVIDEWRAAPEAGLKWFLKDDAYLHAMIEYDFGFSNLKNMDDGWSDGTFVYMVGFGLRF